MVTRTRVSLEAFLAMPETEPPSELIDGEVIQKVAPNIRHGRLTARLIVLIGRYCDRSGEAFIANEVRHLEWNEERVFLPDISIFAMSSEDRVMAAGAERPVDVAPDLAIEVLSPGTTYRQTAERAAFYMRAGTKLLWIVDPEDRSIAVHRPGEAVTFHRPPDVIDAQPVLSEFTLDLAALFRVLDGGRG